MGRSKKPDMSQFIGKIVTAIVVVVVVLGLNVFSLAGVYYDQKNSIRQNQKQEQGLLKKIIRDSRNSAGRGK